MMVKRMPEMFWNKVLEIVVLVVVVQVYWGCGCHHEEPPPKDEGRGLVQWGELYSSLLPRGNTLSQAECETLKSKYAELAQAYERRDTNEIRRIIGEFPATNDDLAWSAKREAEAPLAVFRRTFLFADETLDFSDASEFVRFIRSGLEVARFYAALYGRRKNFLAQADIEPQVYSLLRRYKEKFHAEARADLEELADRFLSEWIRQIESPDGFTRLGIRWEVLRATRLADVVNPGDRITSEGAVRMARAIAGALVKVGYTPKWLDEEWGNAERQEAQQEGQW